MTPAFIDKSVVRRECRAVYFAGIYFAVLFAASAVVLYMADKDSLCAASVALAGVCAGVAIGAESLRRGCG